MAIREKTVNAFESGVHNLIDEELIPRDAASRALGWLTKNGRIELSYGRQAQGAVGAAGKVLTEWKAAQTDGTSVRLRKIYDNTEGKVQYLDSGTWTDVITGLSDKEVTFSNYSSVAGNHIYITSPEDGIYKIVAANPDSFADMYDSARNFKGYSFIDRGRMIMWNTKDDATGLYGSFIDSQDSDVYTTVSAESIGTSGSTNYTGTLAFKAGGSTRVCFGVVFTDGTQTITFDFAGNATGDGTGTINFMSGAYNVTFDATTTGAVTSDYQWEDSNQGGVTDFTKSATRLAGEGFSVRQDSGGDAIQVVVPYEGSYFSFKERSVYQFTLDVEDTNPSNLLIRADVGVSTKNAAVPTSSGIMFMDTGNPSRPFLSILRRNPVGDNFLTEPVFPQFDFSLYSYDDVVLETWDKYLLIACAEDTTENDRLLMCDMQGQHVSPIPYGLRTFAKDGGMLYGGDPVSQTTYELFTGFDDMGTLVQNSYEMGANTYGTKTLKKVKKLRFRGQIDPNQVVSVYMALDGSEYQKVGTIRGDADYVDYSSTSAIGTNLIGAEVIGGDDTTPVYDFLMEIKLRMPKFRSRKLKFVAEGYGYVAMQMVTDFDIWLFQDKLPKANRLKQNVSLDGTETDVATP